MAALFKREQALPPCLYCHFSSWLIVWLFKRCCLFFLFPLEYPVPMYGLFCSYVLGISDAFFSRSPGVNKLASLDPED